MIEFFPIIFGIDTAQDTANNPPIRAHNCIETDDNPRRIAKDAPTQAPEETPSISGATKGFLNTL